MRSLVKMVTFLLLMVMCHPALTASISVYAPGKPYLVMGQEANGGLVEAFTGSVRLFRKDRVRVVLQDHCYSSCTLYTALLKDDLLCARPGTIMGFHQFVVATDMKVVGNTLRSYQVAAPYSKAGLAKVMRYYPSSVRAVISHAGGLPPQGGPLLKFSAKELGIPTC